MDACARRRRRRHQARRHRSQDPLGTTTNFEQTMTRAPVAALLALLTTSCGTPLMKLPAAPGVAASDAAQALASATEACRSVSTISALARVRGSIAGRKTRVELAFGLASPASARLEVSVFSQRVFTLVSTGTQTTLVLDQEQRVLRQAPPAAVLEALTGIP